MISNIETHKLTNIELIEDDGQYYLSVEYLIEDEHRIQKLTIPRVEIPFNSKFIPEIIYDYDRLYSDERLAFQLETAFIRTGLNPALRIKEDNRVCFKVETIKEKEHEMTIEEIEKKLGYKVKIVSGGKKK